jgi:casein kinase II subunit alpha
LIYWPLDIKPDNILVNYGGADGDGINRFSEVALAECADPYKINPDADPFEEGHLIGAAIFRSPEANLQLRWGTATDIWSFGATVRFSSLPRT